MQKFAQIKVISLKPEPSRSSQSNLAQVRHLSSFSPKGEALLPTR